MAIKWKAHGGISGATFLDPVFVESVVAQDMSTTGIWSVRISMASGAEYYGYFSSEQERDRFVLTWAGEYIELDIEPVAPQATYG